MPVAPSKEIEWIGIPHAVQSFGMELLWQECAARPEQNVFVSPLSVFLALAMAENGAGGETKAAMRRVLRVPPEVEARQVNEEAKRLLALLQSKGGIELSDRERAVDGHRIPACSGVRSSVRGVFRCGRENAGYEESGVGGRNQPMGCRENARKDFADC